MQWINSPAQWLTRLVQIPSVTPDHGGPKAGVLGEAAMAAFMAAQFRALGGEVIFDEVLPGRPSVYGIFRNPASSKWIALDCHTDTVGVENMSDPPFDGRIEDGKVWGRGAVDDKASLAVALAVLESMHAHAQLPAANLIVAAVADEEMNLGGAYKFADWLRARKLVLDELVVAEPTLCAPAYGHKGVSRITVHIKGHSVHTSQPQLGKNAISAALKVAAAFEQEHVRLQSLPTTPVGTATLTISMMHGGRAFNIVPDACSISIDRRTVAGESANDESVKLAEMARAASPLPIEIEGAVDCDAFYQPPDSALVQQFARWTGIAPVIVPYGTDASAYEPGVTHKNLLVIGPGSIDQAHGAQEWVAISELDALARAYAKWWDHS